MNNQFNIVLMIHRVEQRDRDGERARAARKILDDCWVVETPHSKKEKFLAEIR